MQPQNSQDALAQLEASRAGQKSASDILAEQNKQYGVQQAGDTVAGLRGAIASTTRLLNQVAPSVMGRTANSLVTNAQATRQIANEQAPISQNLNQENTDYSTALSDYDRATNQASQGANAALTDQSNQTSFLQNVYNTLFQREAAAEDKRRFDEQLALSKKTASSGGIGQYLNPGNTTQNNAPTDPIAQNAYNDITTRINSGASNAQLMSDYQATASSAKYGNTVDLAKLKLYRQLRPDLFKDVFPWEATGGIQPSNTPAPQSAPAKAYTPGATALVRGLPSAMTRGF